MSWLEYNLGLVKPSSTYFIRLELDITPQAEFVFMLDTNQTPIKTNKSYFTF